MNSDASSQNDPSAPKPAGYEPLSARELHEVQRLVSALCDQVITDADWQALNAMLRKNVAARAVYLDTIRLHGELINIAGRYAGQVDLLAMLNDLEQGHVSAENVVEAIAKPPSIRSERVSRSRTRWTTFGAGVAACLFGVVLLWAQRREVVIHPTPQEVMTPLPQITYTSPQAHWVDRQVGPQSVTPTEVPLGHILAIEDGKMELTYPCGTKVWLFGPSEYQVATAGGYLYRGDIVARVSEAGHGFTVFSRNGKVVDLGTEFSLVVDDLGVSRVSVFEGKVEAFVPHADGSNSSNKIELASGRALQWSQDTNSVVKLDAPERHFDWAHPKENSDTIGNKGDGTVRPSKSVEVAPHWEILGVVDQDEQGFVWSTRREIAERSYCVSADRLDPVQQPLEVNCVWSTVQGDADSATSFTILTRTVDRRSGHPGQTWSDMLASGLRCSLKTFPEIGQANLEIAIKQEADREPSVIAMTRGLPLVPDGGAYEIRVNDDGVNVSFVVRHADHHDIVRSVRCRSLYRSEDNRVALEGGVGQRHVVQQLQIHKLQTEARESPTADETNLSTLADQDANSRVPLPWDPPGLGARCLVDEDFASSQLDPARWDVLGDVRLDSGRCQLGLANPTQHIDTWKQRPYLILKQPLDSKQGQLVIMGRMEFSDNVLRGYGGSFAVFTRATPSYGGGASWERSILVSGLRSNFWPVAEGFGHSLEIHERRHGQAVKLLAATGFAIRPESREYAFRLTDDGVSASLTVADLADRQLQQSISHVSTSPLKQPGYLAFESCWGSPVWIDQIMVYQLPVGSK